MDEAEDELQRLAKAAPGVAPGLTQIIRSLAAEVEREVAETKGRAEQDAEAIRRAALESAGRILEIADGLDIPMRELERTVQSELAAREEASRMSPLSEPDGLLSRFTARGKAAEVLRHALEEADVVRSAALDSTERIFRQVEALGKQLADLDRAIREEQSHSHVELVGYLHPLQNAVNLPLVNGPPLEEADAERVPDSDPASDLETNGSASSVEREPVDLGATSEQAEVPRATPPLEPEESGGLRAPPPEPSTRRGMLSRIKERVRPRAFVQCSICGKTSNASTARHLAQHGWRTRGDAGLCPDCQEQGWELPEGAPLPFRRGVG